MAEQNEMLVVAKVDTAAVLLASGEKINAVAKKLGVTTKTIRKWMDREDFKTIFYSALDRAMEELQPEAISILREQLLSKNEWIAQGAIRLILEQADKRKQQSDQNVVVTFANMLTPGAPQTSGEISDSIETQFEDG